MAYETRELSGSVFKNRKKEKQTHPDYTGEAKINGEIYWVSCWEKKDRNGNPWFSFAFKKKDFAPALAAVQSNNLEDEIPF